VSQSSRDSVEALALKTWLERAEPGLVGDGPKTVVEVDGGTESVEFLTASLTRLQKGLRGAGTRVLGRWHAATVHFLCPREQA
jgi:hypothetical protein